MAGLHDLEGQPERACVLIRETDQRLSVNWIRVGETEFLDEDRTQTNCPIQLGCPGRIRHAIETYSRPIDKSTVQNNGIAGERGSSEEETYGGLRGIK